MPTSLSMQRDLANLADERFNVVVVGGGIFGVSLAWEAASRGLSVALVERNDFCGGTSANSYKMVHGGIRYMQHADFPRIRESCRERSSLLRVAPHLVRPLPILVPTYRGLMKSRLAMRTAMAVYDAVTLDRNRGISDPLNQIPAGRILGKQDCLDLYPDLAADDFTGGALFHDGQMYNPTRLALSFLRSAVEAGAQAANYVEASELLREGDRVIGVRAEDRISGESLEIRGDVVINAAGPWAQKVLGRVRLNPQPTFSRDAAFVIPDKRIPDVALAVQGATKDPDAVLSRGERHLFVVPWRQYTMVGVWHVVWDRDPDEVDLPDDELGQFIEEVRGAMPSLNLELGDVSLWNAGCVLFGENKEGATHLSYGKRSWIVNHRETDGVDGLFTVIGVRYTTARGVAERTIDQIAKSTSLNPRRSETETTPVFGAEYSLFGDLVRELRARAPQLDERCAEPLLRNYGARFGDVLDSAEGQQDGLEPLPGATTLKAEITHAIRHEMAQTLSDVLLRRTDVGTGERPSDEALAWAADRCQSELGWDAERRQREIDQLLSRFRPI